MLVGLSGHSWMFASLAWIVGMHEPVSKRPARLCRLTKLILYEDFAGGADRLEVHDETSAHPYRQKGRDCLMTSI